MPMFNVSPEKESQLIAQMNRLGLREADIEEKFVRGSGAGGQKINKTSSCVYLLHKPSGIEVKCQRERSQTMNRFFARRELCDRIEQIVAGERSARQQAAEKIRRQKRRRSRRQKQRMLDDKKHHASKKAERRWSGAD
jgi:protein subunit release factor B